jgi:ABC-type sugar transport system substrate-binding protein
MSKQWYVSKTEVAIVDGKITATEIVLTKPDTEQASREMARRMTALGIEGIAVCPPDPARLKKLMREQAKRRKAAKKMTVADIAEIEAYFDEEAERS